MGPCLSLTCLELSGAIQHVARLCLPGMIQMPRNPGRAAIGGLSSCRTAPPAVLADLPILAAPEGVRPRRRVSVALLVTAEETTSRTDPCATLATHEHDVGLAFVRVAAVAGRALHREDRDHHLAGIAPDACPGLGPHLHNVFSKITAIKYDVSKISGQYIIPTTSTPAAPLKVGELSTAPVRATFFQIQEDTALEARPLHVGVGA